MAQETKYARIVSGAAEIPPGREAVPLALFDEVGAPVDVSGGGSPYVLPSADVDTLGGVKVSVSNRGDMNNVDTYINNGVIMGRVPDASTSAKGVVKQAAAVDDATDDAVSTLNALLASLRAAGILASA